MKLTFWGAARTVTGSMHHVETGGKRYLLDCGLYQGRRQEAFERNSHFPFPVSAIDAVILSHAHMDHSGNLPNLVRQGFQGPIYCTPATRDLIAVMLADSARIQEEDAAVVGVVGHRRHPPRAPLYTRSDAALTVDQCIAVPYGETFELSQSVPVRFLDAGHILGSALVLLTIRQGRRTYGIT